MSEQKSFTGVRRAKHTRWTVRLTDVVSRSLITVGGIGTIAAISLVFVFLAWVVVPMFASPTVEGEQTTELAWGEDKLLRVVIDEYRTLGWAIDASGSLIVFRADTGEILQRKPLFNDAQMTAASFAVDGPSVAVGFSDGTVRLGKVDFSAELLDVSEHREEIRKLLEDLPPGGVMPFAGGIAQRMEQGGFRHQKIAVEFDEPIRLGTSPVMLVDHYSDDRRTVLSALTAENKLVHTSIRRITAIDGTVRLRPSKRRELPFQPRAAAPLKLLLTGLGDGVILAWRDGHAARYDCRGTDEATLAEEVDLIADRDATLTSCELLLGRVTVMAGDSKGRLSAWFPTRPEDARTVDGQVLVRGHELPSTADVAVTSLDMSTRTRMCLAGFADGRVRLFHVTTAQQLVDLPVDVDVDVPVAAVAIAPKDDALFAATSRGLWSCDFDPKHPEVTLAALFLPVWYEGYNEAEHVWQAGGGSSDLEPKLGLYPLVFGTLKATMYSMLFGAPLALLAAIYTSEFLSPRAKTKIKPTIELMASLPSVVLGFLAGLVIAQFVEKCVSEVVATFVAVPVMILFGAFLWQLPSQRTAILYAWLRLPAILLFGALGVGVGWLAGPLAENVLFAGDIMKWLDGQTTAPPFEGNPFTWLAGQSQGGAGAWFFLLLPTSALAVALSIASYVNPRLRIRFGEATRRRFAAVNLAKYLLGVAATFVLAYFASVLFTLGFGDPRGSIVDTYVQRNSLVVGFIMGFAIIPIIYTIAEDALSTVPEHLRSASLGAGATPWQTALRIVIPTAMSGLFSAIMIGLGRAVGETMIVLMAAGNTPILEWNIFNGFRTLAANIATEMPEAARDSTHYRTLFLAALTLFVMTFAVNTVAEVVRQRFRRRAYQL